MAYLGASFQGEESTFEPIAPGEYVMHITSSGMEPTKDGRGRFLKLELEIVEGQSAGKKLTERLNLENPNSQAVDIAQRTLRSIIFACGLGSCNDSEQLHMRRMLVTVRVEPRNDKPEQMTNRIAGYKSHNSAASAGAASMAAAPQANTQAAPAAAAGNGGSTPPWKR